MKVDSKKFAVVRIAALVFNLTGAVALFYGCINLMAAIITYSRFHGLRGSARFSPDALQFGSAEDVARQGILYGIYFLIAGIAVVAIGYNTDRLLDRQVTLEKRRNDVLAHRQASLAKRQQ